MAQNHMKRLAAPKSWAVLRKERTFITRPKPGRSFDLAMSLNQVMKLLIKKGNTTKEVRYILHNDGVLVNSTRVYDHRLPVGFMDVVSFPSVNEHFLVLLSRKGKLCVQTLDNKLADQRLVKVRSKTRLAGKFQVNAYDGTNVLVDKAPYSIGDSLTIKAGKITSHLPMQSGAHIILTGGSHLGMVGSVKEVDGKTIVFESAKGVFSTARRHAFVVNKDVAEVALQ